MVVDRRTHNDPSAPGHIIDGLKVLFGGRTAK